MQCYPLAYMYRAPNERRRGCSANTRRPRVSTSPSSVYLVISSGPTPRIARMMHVPVAVCCTVVSLVRSTRQTMNGPLLLLLQLPLVLFVAHLKYVAVYNVSQLK